ncbi:MAG: hypothetical protein JW938_06695 [Candidatus Omnitrophica bacterium]|nr:hypothetical protein [Candidatus Omnitrophota bacterium]
MNTKKQVIGMFMILTLVALRPLSAEMSEVDEAVLSTQTLAALQSADSRVKEMEYLASADKEYARAFNLKNKLAVLGRILQRIKIEGADEEATVLNDLKDDLALLIKSADEIVTDRSSDSDKRRIAAATDAALGILDKINNDTQYNNLVCGYANRQSFKAMMFIKERAEKIVESETVTEEQAVFISLGANKMYEFISDIRNRKVPGTAYSTDKEFLEYYLPREDYLGIDASKLWNHLKYYNKPNEQLVLIDDGAYIEAPKDFLVMGKARVGSRLVTFVDKGLLLFASNMSSVLNKKFRKGPKNYADKYDFAYDMFAHINIKYAALMSDRLHELSPHERALQLQANRFVPLDYIWDARVAELLNERLNMRITMNDFDPQTGWLKFVIRAYVNGILAEKIVNDEELMSKWSDIDLKNDILREDAVSLWVRTRYEKPLTDNNAAHIARLVHNMIQEGRKRFWGPGMFNDDDVYLGSA